MMFLKQSDYLNYSKERDETLECASKKFPHTV